MPRQFVAGGNFERAVVGGKRIFQPVELLENFAEVVPARRVLRIQFNGFLKGDGGALEVAQLVPGDAKGVKMVAFCGSSSAARVKFFAAPASLPRPRKA